MSTQKLRKRSCKRISHAIGSEQPKATSETTTTFGQLWAGINQKLQGSEEGHARGLASRSSQTRDAREQLISTFLAVCDSLASSYDVKGDTCGDAVAGLAKLLAAHDIQKVVSTGSGFEMVTKLDLGLIRQSLGITTGPLVDDFRIGLDDRHGAGEKCVTVEEYLEMASYQDHSTDANYRQCMFEKQVRKLHLSSCVRL
jgi:hypothetical protein